MSRKTALITGAARGIGLATAHLMTQQGYQIAMVDKDEDELHKTVGDVDRAKAFICDVADPDAVEAMVAGVSDWSGQIDVVVNNAGVADFGPIEETDFTRWRQVMATNLDGVFLVSQACIPALKQTKGAPGEHRFNFRFASLNPPGRLWHIKSSCHSADPATGRRTG